VANQCPEKQAVCTQAAHRQVILNNWLSNPTGKADGFRGYDWLMEQNNLYTKVSHYILMYQCAH